MEMIKPTPTKRFVLDVSRPCTTKCLFCYYLHSYNKWNEYIWSLEKTKNEIDKGINRGNNYADFTGGEPTIYPYICKSIEYALSKNVRTCIITNGIVNKDKANKIMDNGLDDWLISRHGLENTHNYITQYQNSYKIQVEFIKEISKKMSFRFNCVINKFNQNDIFEIAKEMVVYRPRIINFINMNPHHEWQDKTLETSQVIADLGIVEPLLNDTIAYLEEQKIGVNVRYYPMCCINEKYRRTICNDVSVVFDLYEWDYSIQPKTFEAFRQWGINTSKNVEHKEHPCNICDLQWVCGGVNKHFFRASNGRFIKEITNTGIQKDDFYYYRQHNVLTLQER